ncbi:MAG TPA: hypothetical protein VE912_12310 [Bacteroidales bacterium]|nr:hypothetical protein [Bacteroidales bacterium]
MILHLEGYAKPFFCPISAFSRLRNPRIRLFKEKATEELETISGYLAQKQRYPFVKDLHGYADQLRELRNMDYATLITFIGDREDELLDQKEDYVDPIKQFMNSGQKNIYDKNRVLEPILKEKERAKNERYIGNLRNQRSEFGDLLTAQLNLMVELATPNEDDDKPKRQFIKQSNIHTSYNKKNWKPKKMWMNI